MTAKEQFERLEAAWAQFPSPILHTYQIGPLQVNLAFASSLLIEKITPALKHLQTHSVSTAALTIRLWDTTATGQKLPDLDWDLIDQNGYQGYAEPPTYLHHFQSVGALSALDTARNRAYYVVRKTDELPWWVSGGPLQVIFHAWLRENGMHLTHTAAVAAKDKAVLLTGKGGSGKSTLTLACCTQGLNCLGEDYCILAPDSQVLSIYQSAKWTPYTRALFPSYENQIVNPKTADQEKALAYYSDLFPHQMQTKAQTVATISLRIENRAVPKLEKQDLKSALVPLMMSTLRYLPFYHSKSMSLLETFATQIPHYHLTLSQDMRANVDMIREILAEHT
jgi:hypothetical protein